jgi:hypothetical protein
MARTTISIPDDLKAEMDALGNEVNWSATAAEAFRAQIERIKVRRSRNEGKRMSAAIQRLKASKVDYEGEAHERGHEDGVRWAMERAEYAELKRLSEAWPQVDTTETIDALGAPGVFLRMILDEDDFGGRQSIEDFWTNLGKDSRDQDAYSFQYWDGFGEGALEVFEKVED